ncbi:hypothetical protein WISP_33596 [Willisornis vidua]|uniref:Uncharacterized protein n=1 Tax=Willisornis vidua TaxID=1566151 RepID=A0ABQ9DPZ6_9PASS|nr:hypothetical protein WISP_33596 [Willisornis vidua]
MRSTENKTDGSSWERVFQSCPSAGPRHGSLPVGQLRPSLHQTSQGRYWVVLGGDIILGNLAFGDHSPDPEEDQNLDRTATTTIDQTVTVICTNRGQGERESLHFPLALKRLYPAPYLVHASLAMAGRQSFLDIHEAMFTSMRRRHSGVASAESLANRLRFQTELRSLIKDSPFLKEKQLVSS